ncbi:ATP-dependent DNA helicase RecG [Coxiella endosymbiont of Amblyomma sculptum]|uniref:ATP-dependent DNA helicase RecG n=1 Tax=Coxiella endosymbiont of Amblyomma sculptum TaxID=2487929 RepID=UPI00132F20F7|nr:ATP-dependent DNA helicase RecG [Coxiella endosymbiont of Amblyomma sculptum]QHG92475.1 ATP-dependent DNA helicase RecG [Coxiella endosymbiont of Amblyomma sculptum]
MLNEIPISVLKGVGPKTVEFLHNLNIYSIQDLLFHFPLRYENRTRLMPLGTLQHGTQTTVEGSLEFTNINCGRKTSLFCRIRDETGFLVLKFYRFSFRQYQTFLAKRGSRLRCFGTVRQNLQGQLEMVHPEYRIVGMASMTEPRYLTPVYPTTRGLTQTKLRSLFLQTLHYLKNPNAFEELFPESLRKNWHLPTLSESLIYVHYPPPDAPFDLLKIGKHPAQKRLVIEELVAQQIGFLNPNFRKKTYLVSVSNLESDGQKKLRQLLSFRLTDSQERVIWEVNRDLKQSYPMNRVIQGDVGVGKTVIAAMAIVKIVEGGHQCVVMAPTEILIEQHYRTFQRWLNPLGIKVGCLTGSLDRLSRDQALQKICSGENQVIIGTHALFQKDVVFCKLGLIVVDEQHRFGVYQQLSLQKKRDTAIHLHQLIMTATPIPRTLALTIYSHLDISTISELPFGRQSVTTVLVSNERCDEIIARIEKNCEQGKQVYWVCTLIENSETSRHASAKTTYQKLQKRLTHLTIGLIHGRLNKSEKNSVMKNFRLGKIDLLVATIVIEVGMDIPNANLIIIENAERLGIAQIHQLRGRVGRGQNKSYCILLYQKPLSRRAQERLVFLRNLRDGFSISQKDLELRGPGELLGTKQSGLSRLRIADLKRDRYLLLQARQIAHQMLNRYQSFYTVRLVKRWTKKNIDFL